MGEQQVRMPTERQDICRFDVGMGKFDFFFSLLQVNEACGGSDEVFKVAAEDIA